MTAAYEELLGRQLQWALREGSMHFEEKSAVHLTLRKITQRLRELEIPYAVAGGMALFFHGFRRFTEDVDILVTREGLDELHRHFEGLGYVPLFSGGRNLRDAESGVRIEFLVTGDFPGDGKPKPVAFPEPLESSVEKDGVRWLSLENLIELKIASGMTNPGRLKDLADVQELIRILGLSPDMAHELQPFVREKYQELWSAVQEP
ncbi:MAG: nucleotidyl transferase AbiEii/AbiGii toxin family protein [Planctomycetota bacterium]